MGPGTLRATESVASDKVRLSIPPRDHLIIVVLLVFSYLDAPLPLPSQLGLGYTVDASWHVQVSWLSGF